MTTVLKFEPEQIDGRVFSDYFIKSPDSDFGIIQAKKLNTHPQTMVVLFESPLQPNNKKIVKFFPNWSEFFINNYYVTTLPLLSC